MKRTQSPFVTPLKSDYRAGFEAGLRRAAELAKEHVEAEQEYYWQEYREPKGEINWSKYDEKIDAEAKKG